MKKLLILFLGLFLWGCGQVEVKIEVMPRVPYHVLLENSENQVVGMGVPIQNQIFVTADHLLEKYGDLFWKGSEIDIFSRDFDNNLLFFRLPHWVGGDVEWSDSPPVVGGEIFWINGAYLAEEQVHSVTELSKDQIQKDVIAISGTADLQNSGAPVFGSGGRVFGILVGGDKAEQVSFAVRSDVILKILKENME